MINCIKKLLNKRATKVPQGVTEFTTWANDILDTYGLPNNDSTHFALATAVMHAKNGESYFSKESFARTLEKGAANQIAHYIMNECKDRQQKLVEEEAKKAAEQQTVEVTTSQDDSTSNVQPN